MTTTTVTSQSLADRLAAAKASVTENPMRTVFIVLGVILGLVLLGLGIRFLMNMNSTPAATTNGTNNAAAVAAATAAGVAAVTAANAAVAQSNSTATPVANVAAVQVNGAATPVAAAPVTVSQLADNTVPWWQREFATLPAMEVCSRDKYNPVPFPYDNRNQFYDAQAYGELHAGRDDMHADGDAYATAAATRGDTAAEIYARARSNGIALLNRGAIRDPEHMLPRVDPNSEYMRLFQVGASISDIQKYLPKTADLMKMARERPAGLAFQISGGRPPLYSEGINCERNARIPTRASDRNQLFCINPIDPRELYDYRPHPLLDSVLADGGRYPNGGGFAQDAPITALTPSGSSSTSSADASQGALNY